MTGWLSDRFFAANDESVAAIAALQESAAQEAAGMGTRPVRPAHQGAPVG